MKFHLLAALFIAAYAQSTSATAQSSLRIASSSATSVVQTAQVRAELVAHVPDGVQPGQTVWLGLQLQHQPHWHTYWKNPGDSGLATTLQWTLPTGADAGEIVWPTPERLTVANMVNYGYSDNLLLPVPLKIAPGFAPSSGEDLEVRLAASWLVCKQECVPQEGQFVLRIPIKGSTASHGALFAAAKAASPLSTPAVGQAVLVGNNLLVRINGLPSAWQGKAINAFPELPDVAESATAAHGGDRIAPVDTPPAPGIQAWNQGSWSAALPLSPQRESSPPQLPLILVSGNQSLRTVVGITGTWPPLPSVQTSPAPGAALGAAPTAGAIEVPPTPINPTGLGTWLLAIATAVLGGLILNLMPCVLPVLAIKVLGFSHHGTQQPRDVQSTHRAQGLAYTAGVVLSFVGLGALMLILRAGGEQLGWGFQLQSPPVLVALAALFTLIGLNLAGLFEVGMLLPHQLVSLQARHPVVDAFLSGVLAVAIASPCTAPFMGASLGYAISLPALQALGIFAALGFGLALPFLAAAFVPAVAHWLPKPGAWMDTLRRFLAFPMFATVIWLVWVLGHLSGVNGASALLALLLMLALVIWALTLDGRSRIIFATLSIASYALLAGAIGPLALQIEEPTSSSTSTLSTASGSQWQAWSPGKVEAELAAGRSVFIDFTAAWCITCQYNKKTTLSKPDVLADFAAHKVTLLRADWTRRDPAITVALEQLGRSGVPVYVLHQAGKPPVVFSEILEATALHAALAALGN